MKFVDKTYLSRAQIVVGLRAAADFIEQNKDHRVISFSWSCDEHSSEINAEVENVILHEDRVSRTERTMLAAVSHAIRGSASG